MRRAIFAAVATIAILLVAGPAAATPTGYPPGITVAVSPASAPVGTARTVSGSGCVPDGATVTVTQGGATVATTASSGGAGTYAAAGLFASLPVGSYSVTVSCADESGTASFEVTDAASTTSTTATPTSTTAGTGTNTISVDDTTVTPGQQVTVTACCFAPGTEVRIEFRSDPVLLAAVRADAGGAIAAQVAIPTGATLGAHTISAIGTGLDGSPLALSVGVVVSEAAAAAPTPGSGGEVTAAAAGDLPRTGSSTAPLVAAAALLVTLGAATSAIARRRRTGLT